MTVHPHMLLRLAPLLFVLLWSTGFIFSKLGAPYAEPFTFLAIRFAVTLGLLAPFCFAIRAPWPPWRTALHAGVAGATIHTLYLGGTLIALRGGMPAGVTALIVSLQPVLTALLAAPLLGERTTFWHWVGLAIGIAGALLVVGPKLELPMHASSTGISVATVAAAGLSLLGITIGTLYQKRFVGGGDLRTMSACQFAGALVTALPLAWAVETRVVVWDPAFLVALAWLVVVLSLGAVSLLMMLIRQNAVSSVAALFYLVPCVTALMAWGLFDERLTGVQLLGLALTAGAVLLIGRVAAPRRPT